MALILAVKKCQIPVIACHVDHGWRKKSQEEALWVKKEMERHGIECYVEKVHCPSCGNWEAVARQQRMDALHKIYQKTGAQACFLGHHRTDQAETVLKKVLQGNRLPYLSGMEQESLWNQMVIVRPFLQLGKEKMLSYLQKINQSFLTDPSNSDLYYLRARMRQKLFPFLEEYFQRKIEDPLVRLGQEMTLFQEYLQERVSSFKEKIVRSAFGVYLPKMEGIAFLERRFLLSSQFVTPCPLTVVDTVCRWAEEERANVEITSGKDTIYVDRGRIFILSKPLPSPSDWSVDLVDQGVFPRLDQDRIKQIWQGKVPIVLPGKQGILGKPCKTAAFHGKKTLDQWWAENKIPRFLTQSLPVWKLGEQVVAEFFVERQKMQEENILHASLFLS